MALNLRPGPEPTEKELSELANGARFANMLPVIRNDVEKMITATQTRVFAAIRQGTFGPDLAVSAWHEVFAAKSLLKKYEVHVTLGTDAATKLNSHIKIGDRDA